MYLPSIQNDYYNVAHKLAVFNNRYYLAVWQSKLTFFMLYLFT